MEISMAQRAQTILERLTTGRAARLDNLDALVSSRSAHGPGDIWTQAARTLTNPGGTTDMVNMQVAISPTSGGRAAKLDEITAARMAELDAANIPTDVDTLLGRLTSGRAVNLDKLDALVSTRATQAQVLSDATPFPGGNINATISSRSSHSPVDVRQSVTAGTDPLNSIGRRIFDNLDAAISGRAAPGDAMGLVAPFDGRLDAAVSTRATQAQILSDATPFPGASITEARLARLNADISSRADGAQYTTTRAAYLDNLLGIQTSATYSHPSGTLEQDAVVVTPGELGKYERLTLDMNALTQTTTVRTYVQVDGVNYRLVDTAQFPTDFPTNTKAVVTDLMPGSRTMKVTLQSAVAEGVARNVPYFYVVRSLA